MFFFTMAAISSFPNSNTNENARGGARGRIGRAGTRARAKKKKARRGRRLFSCAEGAERDFPPPPKARNATFTPRRRRVERNFLI